jgi:hypothetical protein
MVTIDKARSSSINKTNANKRLSVKLMKPKANETQLIIFYMLIISWVNEIMNKFSKLWKNIHLFSICIHDYQIW